LLHYFYLLKLPELHKKLTAENKLSNEVATFQSKPFDTNNLFFFDMENNVEEKNEKKILIVKKTPKIPFHFVE